MSPQRGVSTEVTPPQRWHLGHEDTHSRGGGQVTRVQKKTGGELDQEGKGREGKGREGKGREGKGREGTGRDGKRRAGRGREG